MNKTLKLAGILSILPAFAFADTGDTATNSLNLNIRRIGLELSQTSIGNARAYENSPVQQLSASSQDYIKGITDIVLAYKKDRFNWNNSLLMEYGRTSVKPVNDIKTVNENADQILLSSDFLYKCWEYSGLKFGPMARGQYQTEFTNNGDIPRQNMIRGNGGLSLFDHDIIKDLYVSGVYEYDFTYSDTTVSKLAAEFGWRLEYKLYDGVKLSTNGYYREYLNYSEYVGIDLKRDLSAVGRMDVNLWNNFTMGPYVQYRLAKARETDLYGSNLIIGISFSYINDFKLR